MATQLKITSQYKNTAWEIVSEVVTDDPDFPTDVFLWTLDGLRGWYEKCTPREI